MATSPNSSLFFCSASACATLASSNSSVRPSVWRSVSPHRSPPAGPGVICNAASISDSIASICETRLAMDCSNIATQPSNASTFSSGVTLSAGSVWNCSTAEASPAPRPLVSFSSRTLPRSETRSTQPFRLIPRCLVQTRSRTRPPLPSRASTASARSPGAIVPTTGEEQRSREVIWHLCSAR